MAVGPLADVKRGQPVGCPLSLRLRIPEDKGLCGLSPLLLVCPEGTHKALRRWYGHCGHHPSPVVVEAANTEGASNSAESGWGSSLRSRRPFRHHLPTFLSPKKSTTPGAVVGRGVASPGARLSLPSQPLPLKVTLAGQSGWTCTRLMGVIKAIGTIHRGCC